MKSTKHTPGPWKVVGMEVHACDDRATVVCEVTGASTNPVAVADARLIAAAPEMLAALKMAYPLITDKAAREEIGALLNRIS